MNKNRSLIIRFIYKGMILLKGLFICENLKNVILKRGVLRGQVHSVFKNACNIECEDLFITLLRSGKKMSPMSVIVESLGQVEFNSLNIKQGLIFQFTENEINCAGVNLFIDMNNAKTWCSRAGMNVSNCTENELLENIKIIGQGLNTHGKKYGMGPLLNRLAVRLPELKLASFSECDFDKNFEFIVDRFMNFINAVIKADMDGIGYIAQSVIGFGCGLTPAMDDFISGLMIAYIYMGTYYKLNLVHLYKFNNKIIGSGLQKTTKVSSEMLVHSSLAEINEGVQDLMAAILNFNDDNEDKNHKSIIKLLIEVIKYGDTSGTDTALGIYVGLNILTNLRYRRVWINESLRGY